MTLSVMERHRVITRFTSNAYLNGYRKSLLVPVVDKTCLYNSSQQYGNTEDHHQN